MPGETWQVIEGDCVEQMQAMPECSVDAVVCDPPYHLTFMGRAWDHAPTPAESQAQHRRWADEALRVLKPGGHLLAFGGTRTYHRLACAVEDAGFEIRDTIAWMYGSGFPKSLDVGKAIDAAAGATREVVGAKAHAHKAGRSDPNPNSNPQLQDVYTGYEGRTLETAPATPDAERWQGWGTALKPAHEPIVVARKPLSGTAAANVLEHGTGALNVDGCRIDTADDLNGGAYAKGGTERNDGWGMQRGQAGEYVAPAGRWPANVVMDPDAAALLDEQTGKLHSQDPRTRDSSSPRSGLIGFADSGIHYGDSGGASRFFYCAKSSSAERNAGLNGFEEGLAAKFDGGHRIRPGRSEPDTERRMRNVHPTVKPIELMRWLVRLVTPPGGLVLDPFTGSGTTGCAAVLEGVRFVGIEREPEYAAIARARIAWWAEHPDGMQLVERLEAERERKAIADSGQLGLFGEAA